MQTAEIITKTKWGLDPSHSEVQFKAKHLVISTVTGEFKSYDGYAETEEENFNGAEVGFTIDVDSIDTRVKERDNHLKSDDFFAVDKYPQIKFKGLLNNHQGKLVLTGDLTIRDITKEVSLNVEHGGTLDDPYGNRKAGFEVTGSVSRKEFGLKWNAVTEAGSVVVGDEVKLIMNVQFMKK